MNRLQREFFQQIGDLGQVLDALEHLPGALFMFKNLDSRYIYMSPARRGSLHLRLGDDGSGKTDFDLHSRIVAQSYRQNDLTVFKHGRPLINEVHATGFSADPMKWVDAKWVYSSKFPLRNRKGKVIGLVVIIVPYNDVLGKDAELNRLLPAIRHTMENYARRITIGELAKRCGYSESRFICLFKQHMKMTAHAFVEQVRVQHAMNALKEGAASIVQIALDCGFYDHSAFVKRFKKFTGTTPLRYRRAEQAEHKSERAIALLEPAV